MFQFGTIKVHHEADLIDNPAAGEPLRDANENVVLDEIGTVITEPEYLPANEAYKVTRIHPNDIKNDNFNRRGVNSTVRNTIFNKVMPNTDIASLDSRDIDTDKMGFNPTQFVERVKTSLENTSRKLTDYSYNAPKSLNIYLGDDKFKKMIPDIMASLPTGTQLQKDSNLKIVVDKEKGMAKIIASVKEGDEYETQTFIVTGKQIGRAHV